MSELRTKITFGREPDPGESTDWLMQVNPFAQVEDVEHFAEGLRRAGFAEATGDDRMVMRPPELPSGGETFRRDEGVWVVSFRGSGACLTEVKGFHDLSRLLAEPERLVHCLEMSGAPVSEGEGDVLDPRAKREIEQRLIELNAELDDARGAGDDARSERAEEELDRLTGELAQAFGLGGRARKLGGTAERARSAVTWRIRSAIKKISAAHPRLGQHLKNSVRTGVFCVYSPEDAVTWEL